MKIECALPAHLTAMQQLLERIGEAEMRKGFIIAAHCHGVITAEETSLLIQAYQLETA